MLSFVMTLTLLPYEKLHAEIQIFQTDSLASIEEKYSGQPFLLAVWSIECPPCRDELALLGKLKKEGHQFNLVLVSTDNFSQHQSLSEILAQHQLKTSDNWAFSNDNSEQLRYLLDPEWFGEMPRCYFYDAAHNRKGVSGKLKVESLLKWISHL